MRGEQDEGEGQRNPEKGCLAGCFAAVGEDRVFIENQWNFVDESMDISKGIPANSSGVLARIRERGVLRVATEPYFPPQEFIDPALEGQETYVGADMNFARMIAEKMGVALEIIPKDFADVLEATANDECDLAISALSFLPSRAQTNELSKGYFFVDLPVSSTLIIRAEDAEEIRGIDDMTDRVIVAQQGSLQEQLTVENIHNYREFRRLNTTQNVYDAVTSGEADAGTVDLRYAESYIRNNPESGLMIVDAIQFKLLPQYEGDRVAAKKGELELMYFVNGVIDEMLSQGLYMQWYEEAQKRADELGL